MTPFHKRDIGDNKGVSILFIFNFAPTKILIDDGARTWRLL